MRANTAVVNISVNDTVREVPHNYGHPVCPSKSKRWCNVQPKLKRIEEQKTEES